MSDDTQKPKIKIPPLRKKRRTLADLGADSLAAALNYRELMQQEDAEPPAEHPPANPEPGPKAKKRG